MSVSIIPDGSLLSVSKYMAELKHGARIPIGRTKYKDIKAKWL